MAANVRVHSLGSHDEYSMAACGTDLSTNRLKPQACLCRQPANDIHYHHLLLLLSPKADTHFTVPRRQKAESTSVAVTYRDGLPIRVLTGTGIE